MQMSALYDSEGNLISLGSRVGAGAEGEVFEVHGRDDLVAKIYFHQPDAYKIDKLTALSAIGNERIYNIAAWPLGNIYNSEKSVVGFLMKNQPRSEEVHALHSPRSRLKKFPKATWQFLIYAASNLARAVSVIHEQGIVIGDINPKNILVTRNATIHLLDCDSFQIRVNGTLYRCESGFPEYTAPELHGTSFRDVDRTIDHDYFGLAISIFQLLFIGRHPFAGRMLSGADQSLDESIKSGRFAYGKDAKVRGIAQPPGSLALDALPGELTSLFYRAFLSENIYDRPTPQDWIKELDALSQSLTSCYLHSGHVFYDNLKSCPWCEIENNSRTTLFHFNDDSSALFKAQSQVPNLGAIWAKIESFRLKDLLPSEQILYSIVPEKDIEMSGVVKDFLKIKRHVFWLSMIVSSGLGIVAGGLPCCCPVPLLMLPLSIPYINGNKFVQKIYRLWYGKNSYTGKSVAEHTKSNLLQAEKEFYKTEYVINRDADFKKIQNKLEYLDTRRDVYENLDRLKEERLKEIDPWADGAVTLEAALDLWIEQTRVSIEREVRSSLVYLNQMKSGSNHYPYRVDSELIEIAKRYLQAKKENEALGKVNGGWPVAMSILLMLLGWLIFYSGSIF